MLPDYLIALTDLHEKTPQFFRDEVFAHGDAKTRIVALRILRDGLDPVRRSSPVLRAMMQIESKEHGNAG